MSQSPPHIENCLQQAVALHRQGDLDGAEMRYLEVLTVEAGHTFALTNLGVVYVRKGLLPFAQTCFEKALKLDEASPTLWYQLAFVYQQQGQRSQACAAYDRALALKPDYTEAYSNRGVIFMESGQLDAAIRDYRQAIALNPQLAEAHANLGFALVQTGALTEAEEACRQAITLRPDFPAAYQNLGCILHRLDRLDEAETAHQKALALQPEDPVSWHNLGLVLYAQGKVQEAIVNYQRAIALRGDYAEAHFSLAVAHLLAGNMTEGWPEYEWRVLARKGKRSAPFGLVLWTGEASQIAVEPPEELILWDEQGIGDVLQFVRVAPLLRQKFGKVSMAVREPLQGLLETSGLFDHVYALPNFQAERGQNAQWAYLLSMPGLLGASRNNPLLTEPYLQPPVERAESWRGKLRPSDPDTEKLIVGLNWQGDPASEKTEFRGRSFPLAEYEPLAAIAEVQFVSLQKGYGAEQLETCTFKDRFAPCQDEISQTLDWVETAAIVQSCDLIITSDTSIAHLAGAMGKPVWILLKKVPDWRWGLEGEVSPWYPSARLFRQTEAGNWAEVMQRVQSELSRLGESLR